MGTLFFLLSIVIKTFFTIVMSDNIMKNQCHFNISHVWSVVLKTGLVYISSCGVMCFHLIEVIGNNLLINLKCVM